MNIFKSHFWYNKNQRNGIFFLLLIIILLQIGYSFVDFSSNDIVDVSQSKIIEIQKQIDSLKAIAVENRKPKIYPFNPNFITDYKGEQLGMSLHEIDRLLVFRKNGKFVNSKREFQRVTKISDSLLAKISPYFKFPDWVVKRNQQNKKESKFNYQEESSKIKSKNEISTFDVNYATIADFQYIEGVNSSLAERIVKYRSKLQGFSFESQLYEVFNINKKVANKLLSTFKIIEKPIIKKINVNTIEFRQLLRIPYIDYELCKKVFNYRDEVAELQNISELKNIEDFPLDRYDRIVLYLVAK